MNIPPLLPGVEHSILVEVGWDRGVRVSIDGLSCPGCGTPLHQCQSPTGVLTDHTTRATGNPFGSRPIPAGARMQNSSGRWCGAYCEWDADRLSAYAFQLARGPRVRTDPGIFAHTPEEAA